MKFIGFEKCLNFFGIGLVGYKFVSSFLKIAIFNQKSWLVSRPTNKFTNCHNKPCNTVAGITFLNNVSHDILNIDTLSKLNFKSYLISKSLAYIHLVICLKKLCHDVIIYVVYKLSFWLSMRCCLSKKHYSLTHCHLTQFHVLYLYTSKLYFLPIVNKVCFDLYLR